MSQKALHAIDMKCLMTSPTSLGDDPLELVNLSLGAAEGTQL